MAIGKRDEVRDLTGIFNTSDLPDARIDAAIQYGKGELYSVTFKTDWDTDTSHPLFYKAETLVHYFASFHILDRYSGNFEKANTHRERAKELALELKTQYDQYSLINDSSGGGSGSGARFSVVASNYKSFPLNPDAEITKSKVIIPGD